MNVLFILADDLGWGDLGCYGRPDYETPVLDALAARGLRFTQAYANSSSCSPTRVAIATGRYQQRLEVGLFDPLPPGSCVGLPDGHPTLPGSLQAAGYRTALVGKWHLGEGARQGPLHHGYDEFFGFLGGAMTYFSHRSGLVDCVSALRNGESPIDRAGYATDLFADRAIEFVLDSDTRPFFLSLHFNAPHWPWEGPEDEARARDLREMWHYEGGSLDVFAAMVRAMDSAIGRVLAALEQSGKGRDTLVIFTSDNGGERYSYHWPLRGEKGSLWEGGIRVPAIVAGPGVLPGRTTSQVAMSMDWAPTILARADPRGAATFASDGIDLWPALAGSGRLPERTVYWRTQDMAAARRGPWKYVRCGRQAFLANLDEDVTENANLRLSHSGVFLELESAYRDWNSGMLPPSAAVQRLPWQDLVLSKRSLADLGES